MYSTFISSLFGEEKSLDGTCLHYRDQWVFKNPKLFILRQNVNIIQEINHYEGTARIDVGSTGHLRNLNKNKQLIKLLAII